MGRTFKLPDGPGRRINVIVASTGSVATIKVPDLLRRLVETQAYNIVFLPSHTAQQFLPPTATPTKQSTEATTTAIEDASVVTFRDSDEWRGYTRGDEILHIVLRNWCDILLIAPLSAHTLAKVANGLSDSLLLEVLRAWAYTSHKALCCAPAMNTAMYTHPFTSAHLDVLRSTLGFTVLDPISKVLACGDVGIGAMIEVEEIVKWIKNTAMLMSLRQEEGD